MKDICYYLVYKPFQTLCQFSPEENKKTLKDYFSVPTDVYPVGRLDFDSEGLLLLTNDKELNHRLLNPKFAHKRTYLVQVDGSIDQKAADQLTQGVDITVDGKLYHTKRCQAKLLTTDPVVAPRNPPIRYRKTIPAPWLELTLTEGKNRQVRKMCASVGFPVLRLIRIRIGNLSIENIQPGDMIALDKTTINKELLM